MHSYRAQTASTSCELRVANCYDYDTMAHKVWTNPNTTTKSLKASKELSHGNRRKSATYQQYQSGRVPAKARRRP
jgi:hypothetical protein